MQKKGSERFIKKNKNVTGNSTQKFRKQRGIKKNLKKTLKKKIKIVYVLSTTTLNWHMALFPWGSQNSYRTVVTPTAKSSPE